MKTLIGIALVSFIPVAALADGAIVVSTPSGQSTFQITNGAASHTTSNYSAGVNEWTAGPGQHMVVTPNMTQTTDSRGQTATVTVIQK